MLYEEIALGKPLPLHEDYKQLQDKCEFWEESVEVDEEYYDTLDPNGNPILKKFTCEEAEDFKFRKSICSPRNYMIGILNKYQSTVFKNAAQRDDNEFYNNVDLLGSSMNEFMKMKLQEANIYGASYMMPDSTASNPSLSEAQKRQMGVRPFIRSIDGENVLNWSDYLGHLQEVIVLFEDDNGSFAMYYNNEFQARIQLDEKDKVVEIGPLEVHNYPFIPVVRLMPFDTDESFVAAGSLTQMTINNLLTLEKTEIFGSTFTRYFGAGIRTNSEETNSKVTWGNNRLIVSESADATITPLGADPAQAQSIRDSIEAERQALFGQYHLSATQVNDTTQTPSGYALIVSKEDFNSICTTMANACERAENNLIALLNDTEALGLQDVVYSREFIIVSKAESILQLRDILSLSIPEDMKALEIEKFKELFYSK
jgi:hypothetical protein